MNPDGSSLIRVQRVCFHDQLSEVHLNICSRRKKQTFPGIKSIGRISVKFFTFKKRGNFVCLFDLILYVPLKEISAMSGQVFLG